MWAVFSCIHLIRWFSWFALADRFSCVGFYVVSRWATNQDRSTVRFFYSCLILFYGVVWNIQIVYFDLHKYSFCLVTGNWVSHMTIISKVYLQIGSSFLSIESYSNSFIKYILHQPLEWYKIFKTEILRGKLCPHYFRTSRKISYQ